MSSTAKNLDSSTEKENQENNLYPLEATVPLANPYKKKGQATHSDDSEQWLVSYADMMTLLVGFFVMLQSFSKIDENAFEKIKKEATSVFGGEYKIPHEKLAGSLKDAIKNQGLGEQVVLEPVANGVVLNFRGALFFDSGSTTLKESGLKLMKEIIPIVAAEAKGFSIIVEGHTDNRPVAGGFFPSNWELSSFRACTVLRLFEEAGFEKTKLKALGWSDSHPIFPNENKDGSQNLENQAQNRRVVIKILKNIDS